MCEHVSFVPRLSLLAPDRLKGKEFVVFYSYHCYCLSCQP